jgi:hypothetical protein
MTEHTENQVPPPNGVDGGGTDFDSLFDNLDALRVAPNYTGSAKPATLTCPVRKPSEQTWFRIRPEPTWSTVTTLFKDDEGDWFLVAPSMRGHLGKFARPAAIYCGITAQGTVFLWPILLHDEKGKLNRWHETGHAAARQAMQVWTRIESSRDLGGYRANTPTGHFDEPVWPEDVATLSDLLRLGFGQRIIDKPDHPLLQKLRGAVLS